MKDARRSTSRVILGLAVLALAGCAGQGIQGGVQSAATSERVNTDSSVFINQSLGRVDRGVFSEAMEKVIIGRYRFSLRRREEQFQTVYYETLWVLRPPTEEEREAGVLEARHRIIVEGRRAQGTAMGGDGVMYRLGLRAENEVRTRSRQDWHAAEIGSQEVRENMRRMVSDLQLEIRAGG